MTTPLTPEARGAAIEGWLDELGRVLAGPLGTDIRVERIRSALPAAFRAYRDWGMAVAADAARSRETALREIAEDATRQAHGFMHYGSLEECRAGICVKRRAALTPPTEAQP